MAMKVEKCEFDGLYLITPDYFSDERGYFAETYSERALISAGINPPIFVQDNQSFSAIKGTVRGIHFQLAPTCQCKLIRCIKGRIFDVAVDLRRDSKTYKKWIGFELSEENHRELLIPAYCGHAFITLEDNCLVQYKVDEFYSKATERSIKFDDPDIAVDWPIAPTKKSQKDLLAPSLDIAGPIFTMSTPKWKERR